MVLDLFAIILLQVFEYFGDVKLLSPFKTKASVWYILLLFLVEVAEKVIWRRENATLCFV